MHEDIPQPRAEASTRRGSCLGSEPPHTFRWDHHSIYAPLPDPDTGKHHKYLQLYESVLEFVLQQ